MDTILTFNNKRAQCPFCNTVAHHVWYNRVSGHGKHIGNTYDQLPKTEFTICAHCGNRTIWVNERMIYPESISVPLPNPDLPEEIQSDYLEAAAVLPKSTKAAAALLRLCLQKLCKHLGRRGDNINNDIKELVKEGLPVTIQKAMDSIRIIGNNAVHPGEIDPNENPDTAIKLFSFINIIAQTMITQPKEIELLYSTLPEGARSAIERRDGNQN